MLEGHERKKNWQDETNSSGIIRSKGVKAYEQAEVASHVVQEKGVNKGTQPITVNR